MLLSCCKRVLRFADRYVNSSGGVLGRGAMTTRSCKVQQYNMQGSFSAGTARAPPRSSDAAASAMTGDKFPCCEVKRRGCHSGGDDATRGPPENGAAGRPFECAANIVDDDARKGQPFECARTFCPPERGEHCPLAQRDLPQPRGDLHLDGFQHLKRSLKCPHAYHALLVDAAGTLIDASQSTQQIYHEIGLKYGIRYSEEEIAAKYKAAYGQPWCRYRMRYEDDGRLFWQCIVQEATGCKDPALLDDLYHYYTTEKAWHIGDPNAEKAFKAMRARGIKLAVVSNFDTRLRPLMRVLQCYDWFDTIVVSAEVGLEKPNPEIFRTACRELGVKPEQVLHVGDDKTNDIVGASAAGCDSLLWGVEVTSFAEVAKKLGVKV